jgi:TRAP transporter TAXI family solute receptor
MKKNLFYTIIAVVIVVVVVAAAFAIIYTQPSKTSTQTPQQITIYTGGTGGTYFPIGSAYAQVLSQNGIPAVAVTSGASITNILAIKSGSGQAALVQNDIAYYAYNGLYMFQGNITKNLRGIAALYSETAQFVVLNSSNIHSLQDLKGKKVAIGAAGSGNAVDAQEILQAAGVWNSITPVYMDYSKSADSLSLGEIDCGVVIAGAPTSAITQISVQTPVRLLPITNDTYHTLISQGYTFFVQQVVPKGTYNGMSNDTLTVAVRAILVVSTSVPDSVVYNMTKLLFNHLDALIAASVRAKDISLNTAFEGMSIPLAPGAIKYYKEMGLSVPNNLIPS